MVLSPSQDNVQYTPFPDLTGWRSSAVERGSRSSIVHASYKDKTLSLDCLKEASNRLSAADPADLIVAAWCIVLIHLLSQEDDIDVHVDIGESAHLHLFIPKSGKKSYAISSLLSDVQQRSASDHYRQTADNTISVNLSKKEELRKQIKGAISFAASLSEEDDCIEFVLQASPMIHNASSAPLHLSQVVTSLKHLCYEATTASPALSLQGFSVELLAEDNPRPLPLLDDIEDLEYERLEHQMERVVRRFPKNIAFDFRESLEAGPGDEIAGNYLWSYHELDRRARIISIYLQGHLNKQENTRIVALCLEKSPFTYLAILAVLMSGAAWCPIDTDWPAARKKALLVKSGAKILLTAGDRISSEIRSSSGIDIIRLDSLDYSQDTHDIKVQRGNSSDDLAYLIWTSGTTGLPKAVGIQHKAAVQALRSLQRVIPHNDSNFRYLQFSAYNFDLMILDVFYTWGLGGTLCSGTRSLLLTRLTDLSNAFQATHTLLTPAVLAMTPRQAIPSLQVVINGGEKLSQIVADTWSVECCLLNLYGPAEATLIAMHRRVPQRDSFKAPNIGRALPTTSCHAISNDNEIILKGAIGQLVLGGHQCALGYIGEKVKTEEHFIEHPQLGRIYKTGDLVRQLWNDEFEYLGRSDDQIKVNGIRIELLEINNVIRNAMDEVKDSETLAFKSEQDGNEETQLINFSVEPIVDATNSMDVVRLDEEAIRAARQLMQFAAFNLPSYMVPSLFIIVSHYPRTSSAKIDREALRREFNAFDRLSWLNRISNNEEAATSKEEIGPQESLIRYHIAQLCGIAETAFGPYTAFPSLGLNSIKAISLSHRLMQAGLYVTVVDVVQCPTIASLLERLHNAVAKEKNEDDEVSTLLDSFDKHNRSEISCYLRGLGSPSSIKAVLPVSPLQEVLLSETIRDPSRYWLHRAYKIASSIDMERLQQAIQTVVESVDILRTCFVQTSQLPSKEVRSAVFAQIVLSNTNVKIESVKVDTRAEEWDQAVLKHVQNKLSLQVPGPEPPIGFLVVKGEDLHLVAVLHHALYDQVTLEKMEDAIAMCYEGNNTEIQLDPFSTALQHLIFHNEKEEQELRQTWKRLSSKYPAGHVVSMPNLSGHDTPQASSATRRYVHQMTLTMDRMIELARQLQTSIRPILQAAWASILCAHCDTNNVLLGDSISTRTASCKYDNIAGPLLDTLPVPICIDSTYRTIITDIDRFHKQAIGSLPVPLRHIRAMVAIPNEFPLFTSVFVFEPPSDRVGRRNLLQDHRDFGLSVEHNIAVEVSVTPDGHLTLGLVVKDDLINSDYASIILSQWDCAIHQAITQPDSLASDFSPDFFSEELLSMSRIAIPCSLKEAGRTPVFTALSKWSINTPDAIAIEYHASMERTANNISKMTYYELEKESTRMCNILKEKVAIKSVVAVCLHRGLMTYIVMLATFKAGLTYLPIDPSLPTHRKTALIKQSKANCLVWSDSTQWQLEQVHSMIELVNIDSPSITKAVPSTKYIYDGTFDMSCPAYIIFTSGSTGTPKGCVLTHKNLSSTIEAFRLTLEEKAPGSLDQTTRFLARSVEAFDVAFLETLMPLQIGGTIVTSPRNIILQDMARAMKVLKVTHAAVVPSLFYSNNRRIVPADVPCLKALIVGGERVTQDIITTWPCSNVPLLNAYGPSETCIGNSIARLSINDSTSNIGAPFPGTQYLVLKFTAQDFRTALRGEAGELCIGGQQVGSYLDESITSSFIMWKGRRFYRTGDQVRLRMGDIAEYLGRLSNGQVSAHVKLRGVRIELTEVDLTLIKVSSMIRFCVTRMVITESSYLVTYIANKAFTPTEYEQLQHIMEGPLQDESRRLLVLVRERLPSYMVPRIIVPLEQIPLSTTSGKIDGKRLDSWYLTQSSKLLQSTLNSDQDNERELNNEEAIVAEEIQKLLCDKVIIGPLTDVFSLGLDSLNIIHLAGALERRGIMVDISYIMSHPTVEAIAQGNHSRQSFTLSKKRFDYTEQVQKESKLHVTNAFSLLPLQESMITQTLSEESNDTVRYINIIRLSCKMKDINCKRLEDSIEEALCSHDIYRTVFIEVEGRMVQSVLVEKPIWRMDEDRFEMNSLQEIRKTLGYTPPLRYCITKLFDILIAIHHALYDGQSLADLLRDIEGRYYGRPIGRSNAFSHYVEEINIRDMEAKLQAWKDVLYEYTITHFPCLTGEKVLEKDAGRRLCVEYRPSISLTLLKAKARQEKITLQLLFIDVFARLYGRYTDQSQILFGLVLGGRTSSNNTVHGPCINTVPFCYHTKSDDWKKHITSTYASAIANQHISLPSLARSMQLQGSLFNTLFSYLGYVKENDFFAEISSTLLTEYPFAVEVQELLQSDQVELRAVFDPDHLPLQQVELFLRQFEELLTFDSPLSTPTNRLLAIENEHPVIPHCSDHFLASFDYQVKLQPSSVAFVFSQNFDLPNKETTYQQLDQISTAIANELLKIKGSIIGVLLKQCQQLYPLLIAIWKAGKIYLPLSPSLPFERLAYMISVAKPASIIALQGDLELAGRLGTPICVDKLMQSQTGISVGQSALDLNKAAYIMFTSGSTGTPKGVQVSHLALAAAIYSWDQLLPFQSNSRILQLASPGFDVFLIEVCMPLALGFSFGSAAKEELLNDLETTFSKLQLTMADLPAVLAATIQPDKIAGNRPLQWLMSGGDVIEDRVIKRWSKYSLINAWGPTETTIGNTLGFVNEKSSRSWVGKAYPTSSIYILESTSTAITYRGCIGEIAVGGPQLADGYVGNTDLTKEKFIVLPNGVRVYRTGDRGRLLYDGSLECLGRLDDGQVKINSQRVELREIELQLKRKGGIQDALVLYLEHSEMQSKQLVAFIVVQGGRSHHHVDSIRFYLNQQAKDIVESSFELAKERLASYMIPSLCLIIAGDQLPLTPNSKVDSKAIQAVYSQMTAKKIRQLDALSHLGENQQQDWTHLEKQLRVIIAEFCKVEETEVERDVSFYRLGIDSISGFRLLRKMREEGGFTRLSLRDLLQSRTINLLARLIEKQQIHEQEDGYKAILQMDAEWRRCCNVTSFKLSGKDQIKRLLPCTPLQEGLLLESLSSNLYVHHHLFKVNKRSLPFISDAIRMVVYAHDILRTSFHLVDGQFIQAIHTEVSFQVEDVVETSDINQAIQEIMSVKRYTEEVDLARPLLKLSCLESPKEGIVVIDFCLHHALYDGETLEMLFNEIEIRASGKSVQSRLTFERLLPFLLSRSEDENFIANQLINCQDTLLDLQSRKSNSGRNCHYSERLLGINMDSLGTFASQLGVSIYVIALYAFVKLLCHLTHQRDVVFSQLFSLRDAIPKAEDVIGPALNSILTRVALPDAESTLNTLTRIQLNNDATREFRRASMAKVLSLTRNNARGKAVEFDTLFDFQQGVTHLNDSQDSIMTPWELQSDTTTSQYALNIQFRQRGNSMSIIAVGDSTLFSQTELQRHLETLEKIIQMTMNDCNQASTKMPQDLDDLSQISFTPIKSSLAKQEVMSSRSKVVSKVALRDLSEEEGKILAVVKSLSKLQEGEYIDVVTPINQLGLDSIMAIKLASQIRAKGFVVGVADVLQGKTVEGICRRIAEKKAKSESVNARADAHCNESGVKDDLGGVLQALGMSMNQVKTVLPLLPGQEFELAEYINSKGKSGIFTFLYCLKVDYIDLHRMEKAWKRLCKCHDILRTCFLLYDGSPRQVILSDANANSWHSHGLDGSLSNLLKDERAWSRWIKDVCRIDTDLRSPPNSACLISAKDGHFFALRLHHALYDAWTINFLMRHIWILYNNDDSEAIKAKNNDHSDLVKYLIREKEFLADRAMVYWKMLLEDISACFVGLESSKESSPSPMATASLIGVIKDVSQVNKRFRSQGVSLGTAFIAAWSQCLFSLFPSHNTVVFGLYRRGRTSDFDGIERVASNCMNVLPLVVQREKSNSSLDLCRFIKHQMDEQAQFESTTSQKDILKWTKNDEPMWNTYLNLILDDGDDDEQKQQEAGEFMQYLDQIAVPECNHPDEAILAGKSDWMRANLGETKSEININLHWNRKLDCIDAAVRYRCNVVTLQEVERFINDMMSSFLVMSRTIT